MVTTTWLPEVAAELTQGDVLAEHLLGASLSPPVMLKVQRDIDKHGKSKWTEADGPSLDPDGMSRFVARGRQAGLLVLSHSCEIDKATRGAIKKGLVLVAPLVLLSTLGPEQQTIIRENRRPSLFPLVGMAGAEDHYADLRAINSLQARSLLDLQRKFSMTDESQLYLQASLVAYFTRAGLGDEA